MEVCRGRIGFVVFIQVVVMGVVVVAVSIRILSLAFVVVAGCCRYNYDYIVSIFWHVYNFLVP